MKKIQAIGYKREDEPFQMPMANTFRQQLDTLPPGKYQVTVEKYVKKATHSQFKYLYGLVYKLAMIAGNDAGYEFKTIDEVDIFFRGLFANKEVLNRETGEIMLLPLSKSEFLTIDELVYCDTIRNYVSEYWNTNIPDPDPRYKQNKDNATKPCKDIS
jgi:hypothetical protein